MLSRRKLIRGFSFYHPAGTDPSDTWRKVVISWGRLRNCVTARLDFWTGGGGESRRQNGKCWPRSSADKSIQPLFWFLTAETSSRKDARARKCLPNSWAMKQD